MFIVFEGTDGCGKGTQSERLARCIGAVLMKSPDRTTEIGSLIDRWLKGELTLATRESDPDTIGYADSADAGLALQALFLANKVEVQPMIEEAIRTNGRLVMDRWITSAVAYGGADGVSTSYLWGAAQSLIQPDLSFLLDVSVDTSLARIAHRVNDDSYGRVKARIEKARHLYVNHARGNPDTWAVIDGEQPADKVEAAVLTALAQRGFIF
jgi:dTMP kinase